MKDSNDDKDRLIYELRKELAAAWKREESAYEKGFQAALVIFGGEKR